MSKIWDDIRKEAKEEGILIGKIEALIQVYYEGLLSNEQFKYYLNSFQTTIPEDS